jgi:hypothetical protein
MPKLYDIFMPEYLDFKAKPQLWKQEEQMVTSNLSASRNFRTKGDGNTKAKIIRMRAIQGKID